ncbi:MAG: hypothetical protein K6A40_01650 [Solobacterium sp.]|nr:hypothetical protein [Solobacterium sp.]
MKKRTTKHSEAVRRYHSCDVESSASETCSAEEMMRLVRQSEQKKSIILSGMTREEFRELLQSMKDSPAEERRMLSRQWHVLRRETFPYCVESIRNGICEPLEVFHDQEEAAEFAQNVFFDELNRRNHLSVQVCEGRYDHDGWMLDEEVPVTIIAEWNDSEFLLN